MKSPEQTYLDEYLAALDQVQAILAAMLREPPCCPHAYGEKAQAFIKLAVLSGLNPYEWGHG